MAEFTREQMEALLAVHEEAEFNDDLDATMATLVENPVYELPTLGYRIEGRDAVLETYKRMIPTAKKQNAWADRRVHAVSPTTLCREAYVYFNTDEGRKTGQYFALIEFQGDKILGERMYMCDTYAKEMAKMFDEDFDKLPGVHRLQDVSPPPVDPEDRAAMHAANQNH